MKRILGWLVGARGKDPGKAGSRKSMVAAIQEVVVVRLREEGYTGSFPHFRRQHSNLIEVLMFQFDRNGGGFVIETGECPVDGITNSLGKHIMPNAVRAWDLPSNQRKRVKPREGSGTESWFRFDKAKSEQDFREVAREVVQCLESAGYI